MSFADQAVELLLPVGAPQTVVLAAATSSAAIDIATALSLVASGDPMPSGGFHILVSCNAAFTARAGASDPSAAVATDFPFAANTVYRFKVVPATRFVRLFSTPGGNFSYVLASR